MSSRVEPCSGWRAGQQVLQVRQGTRVAAAPGRAATAAAQRYLECIAQLSGQTHQPATRSSMPVQMLLLLSWHGFTPFQQPLPVLPAGLCRTLLASEPYTLSMARVAAYSPDRGYSAMWKPMDLSSAGVCSGVTPPSSMLHTRRPCHGTNGTWQLGQRPRTSVPWTQTEHAVRCCPFAPPRSTAGRTPAATGPGQH